MAELDPSFLLTILGSISGWIFALAQYISNRERYRVEVARPDPEVKLDCQRVDAEGKQYILSTICINNLGKEDLEILAAVHFIDRAKLLHNGEMGFQDIEANTIKKLLEAREDRSTEICKKEFYPELMHLDFLKEYLTLPDAEFGNLIGHNENLKSQRLHLVKEPGFYRATVSCYPNAKRHKELDMVYESSQIIYVPPSNPL